MSTAEIILNMLAEVSTAEISRAESPKTFEENKRVAKSGGEVAGNARRDIESRTGKSVITSKNASELNTAVVDMIESSAQLGKKENDE